MRYKVLLTAGAESDLEALHAYIAEHDAPSRADYVLDKLMEVAEGLATFPERGSYPPELLALGIREYRQTFFKPYRVIYRVIGKQVIIYVITDDRRDMKSLLLRRLLDAQERLPIKSGVAEILYAGRDPFSRKVVIDKGSQNGILAGQPVIDDIGVIGQVTRVYLLMSEVTLLSDKDQAIPLQVQRNGLRAVAYGGAEGGMLDLRFMAANADIRNGDTLVTSGIDGTYPPGLPVATVARIERDAAYAFAKIFLTPTAGTDRYREVLVLSSEAKAPPPAEAEKPAQKPSRSKRQRKRD